MGAKLMDNVDKYLNEGRIEEASKVYKSLADRIKRAKDAKEITNSQKEAIKIADLADDKLEDV
jgi:soluble cytochrome b562